MKKFHRKLVKLIKSHKYEHIFIDGILLYDDAKLTGLLDKKYFIDLDKQECQRRRLGRQYILEDTPDYFDKCVWLEFTKYRVKCMNSLKNIVYIDGSQKPEVIFNFVISDLKK